MKFTTIAALSLSAVVLAQECPAGYSPVVSYITVTLGPESTSTPPPTTTIYHSTTTILTVTTSIASAGSTASTTSSSDTAVATDDAADESVSASSSSPPAATVNAIEESATASSPSTTDSALSASVSGQATFYGGNVAGGACSFSTYTLPSNIFGTALSDSNWANSASCGACVSVTGPAGNSITAMIVDECPGCGTNHLDLFPDAFSALAPQSEGVIDVSWEYVDCPISSPIQLHNKEGVSEYWFSMQVVNSDEPVSSLEVSTDGGTTWLSTVRQTYNFFEISSGTRTSTVDVRVTSSTGRTVVVNNVGISSGSSVTASSNF